MLSCNLKIPIVLNEDELFLKSKYLLAKLNFTNETIRYSFNLNDQIFLYLSFFSFFLIG